MLRRVARSLRVGKEKYWVGNDLEGNSFYERPSPEHEPTDWRHSKRSVEYAIARPLSEYRFESIPVQWSAWLRRTRKEAPTIAELRSDFLRQERLRLNVARLAEEYREEKLRIAEADGQGLPTLEMGRGEALRATRVGTEEGLEMDRGDTSNTENEEVKKEVERRRREGELEKERLRKKFAMDNAKISRNPSSSYQPKSWDPNAGSSAQKTPPLRSRS